MGTNEQIIVATQKSPLPGSERSSSRRTSSAVDLGLDVARLPCLAFACSCIVLRVDARRDWLDPQFKRIGEIEARSKSVGPSGAVRMARAALNWTVRDLAAATGLHRNTITNIEVGRYAGDPATLKLIKEILIREGVVFIDENGGGPGVRLRKSAKEKPRK